MGTAHHFPWGGPEEINSRIKPKDAGYNRRRGKRNVLVTTFLTSNNVKNNKAVHKINHDKALKIKSVLKSGMQQPRHLKQKAVYKTDSKQRRVAKEGTLSR